MRLFFFQISVHSRDYNLLKQEVPPLAYFLCVGSITKKNTCNAHSYEVRLLKDLKVIIDHWLEKYPLITLRKKFADYEL